ncbi:MAG: FHA domain-containing protein [Pirellulaceae bacterium]
MSIETKKLPGSLVAMIQVRHGTEVVGLHRMDDGTSMILGSDESCGVQIKGNGVGPRHCVVRMTDGKLFVSDWYSDSGTYVNGEKIYCETLVRPEDQLILGPYELRFAVTTSDATLTATFVSPSVTPAADPVEESTSDTFEPAMPEGPETDGIAVSKALPPMECPSDTAILKSVDGYDIPKLDDIAVPVAGEYGVQQQLADANAEIQRLREELEYQLTSQPPTSTAPLASDPMLADDSELMRAEIEHLHAELAQRDTELSEAINSSGPVNESPVDDTETTKLVDRLEQLLDELGEADERVRNLEEMVQVADEATHAEHEERKQLESWVSEIETRIADREQQWRAREEKLQARLEEAARQQQEAAENLSRVVGGEGAEFQQRAQAQIAKLTQRNATLVADLESARAEGQQLEKLMGEVGTNSDELSQFAERQEQIRQYEIDLAQERARVARQKAELTKLREQLEVSANSQELTEDNPDVRTRAFRQHLQEIHEQEQRERKERSLASRISRIWNRLDGR